MFAFATAAVRRAKNQKGFLDEVAVSCGIKLKVLSQDDEAHLVYIGVINSMDIPKGIIM
ncbi:MAG: exopolyphosphatase, partial [Christensenellales bacterium]